MAKETVIVVVSNSDLAESEMYRRLFPKKVMVVTLGALTLKTA